jgi:hypothetical protein
VSAAGVPAVPGGLRAGQLGVVMIGRVIMGDIAVTFVDLAQRGLLAVSEAGDEDDWLLSPSAAPAQGRQRNELLDYEKRLLGGLAGAGAPVRLSALAGAFGSALDGARAALVREAVHQGWLRHLHHDQRTPGGEDLARDVRTFRRDLRRLIAGGDQEVLTGALLPYALHFGLVSGDQMPLARFAHAWVRVLGGEPGWAPPKPKRTDYGDHIAPATDPGDRMLHQMVAAAFIMGGT